MSTREEMIAHMPAQVRDLMRLLFAQLDQVDVDLGLAPQKDCAGLAITAGYKRQPPRDERALSVRLREREVATEPTMREIYRWLATYPAPIILHTVNRVDAGCSAAS